MCKFECEVVNLEFAIKIWCKISWATSASSFFSFGILLWNVKMWVDISGRAAASFLHGSWPGRWRREYVCMDSRRLMGIRPWIWMENWWGVERESPGWSAQRFAWVFDGIWTSLCDDEWSHQSGEPSRSRRNTHAEPRGDTNTTRTTGGIETANNSPKTIHPNNWPSSAISPNHGPPNGNQFACINFI